jgi:hypothetical protein
MAGHPIGSARIKIALPPELKDDLRAIAVIEGISITDVIRRALAREIRRSRRNKNNAA